MSEAIHEASSMEIFPLGKGVSSVIKMAIAALFQPLEILFEIIGMFTRLEEERKKSLLI